MIRVIHHRLGHERRRGDTLQATHGTGALAWSVHAARIELDHTFLVRKATQPNRLIFRVELLRVHAGEDRVERVSAGHDLVVGDFDAGRPVRVKAVGRADDARAAAEPACASRPDFALGPPVLVRHVARKEAEGGERRRSFEELATGRDHARLQSRWSCYM